MEPAPPNSTPLTAHPPRELAGGPGPGTAPASGAPEDPAPALAPSGPAKGKGVDWARAKREAQFPRDWEAQVKRIKQAARVPVVNDARLTCAPRDHVDAWAGSFLYTGPTVLDPLSDAEDAIRLWLLPDFSSSEVYKRVEVVIPSDFLDIKNPAVVRNSVWGTDVYTDDSDIVALLLHSGAYQITETPASSVKRVKDTTHSVPAAVDAPLPGDSVVQSSISAVSSEPEPPVSSVPAPPVASVSAPPVASPSAHPPPAQPAAPPPAPEADPGHPAAPAPPLPATEPAHVNGDAPAPDSTAPAAEPAPAPADASTAPPAPAPPAAPVPPAAHPTPNLIPKDWISLPTPSFEPVRVTAREAALSPPTLIATLRILPTLLKYTGSTRFGIKSRGWGSSHDGLSLRVEGVQVAKGRKGLRGLTGRVGPAGPRIFHGPTGRLLAHAEGLDVADTEGPSRSARGRSTSSVSMRSQSPARDDPAPGPGLAIAGRSPRASPLPPLPTTDTVVLGISSVGEVAFAYCARLLLQWPFHLRETLVDVSELKRPYGTPFSNDSHVLQDLEEQGSGHPEEGGVAASPSASAGASGAGLKGSAGSEAGPTSPVRGTGRPNLEFCKAELEAHITWPYWRLKTLKNVLILVATPDKRYEFSLLANGKYRLSLLSVLPASSWNWDTIHPLPFPAKSAFVDRVVLDNVDPEAVHIGKEGITFKGRQVHGDLADARAEPAQENGTAGEPARYGIETKPDGALMVVEGMFWAGCRKT